MNLPKIHSITKKIFVALVGSFLLLFLLFHMTANLFILRHDDGAWYSAFCHFMGSNWVVKVFEVVLLLVLVLHVLLTVWLAITNRMARPVRYHQPQRSKTHHSSKLMMWTGVLILVCLVMHFCDFYFVKLGWVKGAYMVEREKIETDRVKDLVQQAEMQGMDTKQFVTACGEQLEVWKQEYGEELDDSMLSELEQELQQMQEAMPVAELIVPENMSADGRWVRHIDYDQRQMLKEKMPDCGVEPDFYFMTREKFSHWHIVLGYLFFFVVIFIHLGHAFPSVFQTLGLNNYRYNGIIECCGTIYRWVICLGFAAVPVLVFFGV